VALFLGECILSDLRAFHWQVFFTKVEKRVSFAQLTSFVAFREVLAGLMCVRSLPLPPEGESQEEREKVTWRVPSDFSASKGPENVLRSRRSIHPSALIFMLDIDSPLEFCPKQLRERS